MSFKFTSLSVCSSKGGLTVSNEAHPTYCPTLCIAKLYKDDTIILEIHVPPNESCMYPLSLNI